MKKTSVVNFVIVIGLLIVSVVTIVGVYAIGSSASILIFEENFNVLDGKKWEHQISECKEDGKQYYYTRSYEDNGYVEDSILHIQPTLPKESDVRARRDASTNCYVCTDFESSDRKCVPSLYNEEFKTKNVFDVKNGKIEVRFKLPNGEWMKSTIGISPNRTDSDENPSSERFNIIETIGVDDKNGSALVKLAFGSNSNQSIVHRISKNEFHKYEIEWTDKKIRFKIDGKDIAEKTAKFPVNSELNNSSIVEEFNTTVPFSKPFHLTLGVGFGEELKNNQTESPRPKRSKNSSNNGEAFKLINDLGSFQGQPVKQS